MTENKALFSKNSESRFFIDSSCINCGSCWQIDPLHFVPTTDAAYVSKQPYGEKEIQKALLAVIDCPVAAIHSPTKFSINDSINCFPILVSKHPAGKVYYCGWSSRLSFGASSWLIIKPEGNILIDSPRWSAPLARQIKKMGGLKHIVLTHRDDVADHNDWAKAFNCERWIHKNDADAAPEAEKQIIGLEEIFLEKEIKLIPSPGHTKGSIVVVLGDKKQIVFSGDHLWWNQQKQSLIASKDYCWWNWAEQLKSVERLLELDVSWLLPGHGHAKEFKPGEWHTAILNTLRYASTQSIT